MSTFRELSSLPAYPIIHSQHKDGTVLTAIKVPMDDVRLERWGWILSLSQKNIGAIHENIDALRGNDNRLYPKIYTSDEVGAYAEKNGYDNWEVGYSNQMLKLQMRRTTAPLNINMLQSDMLQETLSDINNTQRAIEYKLDQEISLNDYNLAEVKEQLKITKQLVSNSIDKNIEMSENFLESERKRERFLDEGKVFLERGLENLPPMIYQHMKKDFDATMNNIGKQLDIMDEELKNQLSQVRSETVHAVESSFIPLIGEAQNQLEGLNIALKEQAIQSHQDLIREIRDYTENSQSALKKLDEYIREQTAQSYKNITDEINSNIGDYQIKLENLDQTIKEQYRQNQIEITEEIKGYNQQLENMIQGQLETIKSGVKENADRQDEKLRELNDQIKKLLESSILELPDSDIDETSDKDDLSTVAKKTARKTSTRIARIANGQLKISDKYYENANVQSQRSFQLALRLSWVGGLIFFVTILAVVLSDYFHIQKDPNLLPLGVVVSSITEGLAGLNFLYDRASKQFAIFHGSLDKIIRASIAQAISEEIRDEVYKKNLVERIIENLLKTEAK